MTLVGLTPADPAWSDFLSALTDSDLPVDDLTDAGQFFFVSEAGAYGGFALLGSHALLRSIVTPPSLRGTGEGRRMVEALCREAAEQGASTVWLLTTGAADFFASCGFDRTSRADAPTPFGPRSSSPASAPAARRSCAASWPPDVSLRTLSLPLGAAVHRDRRRARCAGA